MKRRYARNSHLEASVPLQHRKWKTQTDGKSLNSLKASLVTTAENPFLYGGQDEKYRRVIIDIIPCVVLTSLETNAFIAIVAYVDKLMVRATSARGQEEGTRGSVVLLKVQGCVSQGKLRNWEWRLRRDTSEILRMYLVENWIRERQRQSGGSIHKRANLMSEILVRPVRRNNHLRKLHYKKIVSAKQRGIWRENMQA